MSSTSPMFRSQPPEFDGGPISDDSRALARRLSSHMGLEHAIQVSKENQWHGVVAALVELQLKKNRRV